MVSVASVLAVYVSTLRPRDYTKYTARVYGPDPISVRGWVVSVTFPERRYLIKHCLSDSERGVTAVIVKCGI